MANNPRFQVRETEEGLRILDEAIKELGFDDRSHWYKEMKRKAVLEFQSRKLVVKKILNVVKFPEITSFEDIKVKAKKLKLGDVLEFNGDFYERIQLTKEGECLKKVEAPKNSVYHVEDQEDFARYLLQMQELHDTYFEYFYDELPILYDKWRRLIENE